MTDPTHQAVKRLFLTVSTLLLAFAERGYAATAISDAGIGGTPPTSVLSTPVLHAVDEVDAGTDRSLQAPTRRPKSSTYMLAGNKSNTDDINTSSSTTSSCLDLTGIVSGGGEGLLDLDEMLVSLEDEPFDLSNPVIPTVAGCSSGLETTVSMRSLLGIDTAVFSVVSMFHPSTVALDIFGDKETSDARRRCQPAASDNSTLFDLHLRVAVLYTLVYGGVLYMPYCQEFLEALMEERGHPLSLVTEGEPSVDTPWGLAKAYVDEVSAFLAENDGWNADGTASRTANPVPYSDYPFNDSSGNSWIPYTPVNTPWEVTCPRRWQPLTEHDGLGFLFSQEHVTPHIGALGRYFGFNSTEDEEAFSTRQLEDPSYEYRSEALAALEETALTATDDFKQAALNFFDNKFTSLIPLKLSYFTRANNTDVTALDFYRVTAEVQLAIYNGLLLCWKEKVRNDLPRPPTVVEYMLGDQEVETYAGPDAGVQVIEASDWVPFIRTMPHSEYPSASACICQLFAEQIQAYLGSDVIDPPLEFASSYNYTFSFDSWSEISDVCASSRVWAGLHFPAAIVDGADLCGGNLVQESISTTIGRLLDGDEGAAIFKKDVGELTVRVF